MVGNNHRIRTVIPLFLDMAAIEQDQRFDSLSDFKKALRDWAIERGFTPAIHDSDTRRVRAGCRSGPDCPFRIRANYLEKRGHVRVTTCDDVHTCAASSGQPANQEIKRAETSRLAFLLDAVPKLISVDGDTTTKTIIDAIEEKYGQEIALRQAQKVKHTLAPRPRLCKHCESTTHTSGRCPINRRSTSNNESGPQEISPDDDTSGMILDDPSNENTMVSDRDLETALQEALCNDQAVNAIATQRLANPFTATANIANGNVNNGAPRVVPLGHGVPAPQANSRSPQDTRMEAARLMQQAARMMQDAARLNAEAARLTASVANS